VSGQERQKTVENLRGRDEAGFTDQQSFVNQL
jgi:hypothetical protein